MKTKKFLAAIAALTLVCGAVPTQPFAEVIGNMAITASAEANIVKQGSCGENATYTLDSDGVLTISGTGAIGENAFDYDNNTWVEEIKKVEIKSGITSIENYAFEYFSSLTSITIPDSVTSIGNWAFDGCSALTSITIPDSVTSIGDNAFYFCSNLTSITISDSVTSIGDNAFYFCSNLTSITIPDSVTSIGAAVFDGCSSLTSITIPDSVTSIGDWAFTGCSSLTSITIPDSVTSIGDGAFDQTPWLVFKQNENPLVVINGILINGEKCLGDIVIPNSVTSIGNNAFFSCSSLTSITIPDSVTSIGDLAFYDCSSLTSITIPDSVTSIGGYAFCDCSNLTSITIPDSVTSIGDGAFAYCSSLTSITIPDSVTSIGDSAFEGCSSLSTIEIPNSVTSIGDYAFCDCSNLTSITIPDSVTSIGNYAFNSCSSLTSITAPCRLKGNTSIVDAESNGATVTWSHVFAEDADTCECDENVERYINGECGENATYVFDKSTGTLTISGTGAIGANAFSSRSDIKSVVIENGITEIGDYAFHGCTSLTSVTLGSIVPAGLGEIPASAKLIIPAEAYENYKDLGYNLGFSDIKGIGYILEGQIGIRLATDLSADKLVVMCGDKAIGLTQKDGYVEFYVAAQDMAKEYTVYYVDGGNKIEIAKFNPKNNLSGYEGTEHEAVAEALITYCEAANAYFNDGTVADYSDEWDSVKSAIGENTFDMGENYYGSSLLLKSNTILRHYYTKAADGRTEKEGYYYIDETVDPTKFAATGTYSVNDYIYKALTSEESSDNLKNLCVALYNYGVAAEKYIGGTK